ncbi:MAG: hypothetical protein HOY79_06885 [Streptomyces sp.]|nr:hypothetical protein [Streptomyces sp.]
MDDLDHAMQDIAGGAVGAARRSAPEPHARAAETALEVGFPVAQGE